ncbi:hypothetical protein ACFHW2_02755 [Actinomadura sp. LOL_016]|uniref:hypothetical protein n=1 Tax=unclassified Actinomadura TaxID=2626254 RepID=UPI003A8112F4
MSPDPMTVHPLPAHDRVVFLKPLVESPNIAVGDPARTMMAGTPADIERIAAREGNR